MKEPELKEVCRLERLFGHILGRNHDEKFLSIVWKELDRDEKWEYYNDLSDQIYPVNKHYD